MNKFAERLKLLRKQKGLTQVKIAEFLGCTEQHYQRIEYGKINIPTLDLIALADYFDVSLDYLVGRSDDPGFIKAKE
jgi:transcriptional regulator with XRE-family HTH domain